jgi:hypothetical protein
MARAKATAKAKTVAVQSGPPPSIDIMTAIADENLLGAAFRDRETWAAWFAFLKSLFGLKLSAAELKTFRQCTERDFPRAGGHREGYLICGRRAGKSQILAAVATFLSCFVDYRPYLSPGERATVMVIAVDRRQAQVILGYIRGLLSTPLLARLVVSETAESIDLDNRVSIEVHTASFKSVRGRSIAVGLLDEAAFFRSEDSALPDVELVNALKPAMATFPNSMLLIASSPYARKGVLWRAFDRFYGKEDAAPLVWKAPSLVMNPSLNPSIVTAALAEDEPAARAEWEAEFRSDIEAFVKLEVVREALGDYRERPPVPEYRYFCFVDPSGGSADSFTLAIGHKEKDRTIIDAIRAKKPPFSPAEVVDEFARLARSYRIREVVGDRYGGEFPRELFRRHDMVYRVAAKTRSELYQSLLPMLNAGRITLPNNDDLVKQLVSLERRVQRSGREQIDHGPRGHDDIANAVAGVADICATAYLGATVKTGYHGLPDPRPHRSKLDGQIPEGESLAGGFATATQWR